MNLPLIIDPACEIDIEIAYLWYGSRVDGHADRFMAAIDKALNRIQDYPLAYPVVIENVRRAITSVFPYCIYFVIEPDEIVIIACLHQSESPDVLLRRIG